MAASWDSLVSSERRTQSTVQSSSGALRDNCASDRGRVLHCPSFRRLQSKAQVFSLDGGSFVRNRLTHSLEVAHNGIEIARHVTDKLLDQQFISSDVANAIISKTEIACLVHDIGNPPFGHFGEAAIRSWFKTNGRSIVLNSLEGHEPSVDEFDAILHDFVHFDGNPQGFRILTRLANSDFRTTYGLNLTASQLLSCIKYPPPNDATNNRKLGVFSTEREIYQDCCEKIGLPLGVRHPIAFLMDSADDISYCISDIEDGIDQGLILPADFLRAVQFLTEPNDDSTAPANDFAKHVLKSARGVREDEDPIVPLSITNFKASFARAMTSLAAELFVENFTDARNGEFHMESSKMPATLALFEAHPKAKELLDTIKNIARTKLFVNREVEVTELAGYNTITGILNHLKPLLELPANDFHLLVDSYLYLSDPTIYSAVDPKTVNPVHWRLFHLLPDKHIRAYIERLNEIRFVPQSSNQPNISLQEWNARTHLIVDFVSGMTDHFAVETNQRLAGVRI